MSPITTVIISLSGQDRDRPGMYCLPAMVKSFLTDQFELDVAIRIEDEHGEMISESIPLMAQALAEKNGASINSCPAVSSEPPVNWDNTAGLIGN